MPRVSVIVSTYNRAALVVAAIESVLRQSFHDYEIIICGDGSSDDTQARIGALTGPIRYRALEHTGLPGRVRNRGIECARGDLLAFLDDDDLWHPEKLERQVAALEADPAIGLVYTDARLLYPDGSLSDPLLSPRQKQNGPLFDRLLADCFIHPSTALVRRHLLERVGLFDESLRIAEDYDLWLRLARVTEGVCIPEPLVLVRRHPTSSSQRQGLLALENAILVLARQLETVPLGLRRLRGRAALARLHARTSTAALDAGDPARAREHALSALRLDPRQRRAWSLVRQSRNPLPPSSPATPPGSAPTR